MGLAARNLDVRLSREVEKGGRGFLGRKESLRGGIGCEGWVMERRLGYSGSIMKDH